MRRRGERNLFREREREREREWHQRQNQRILNHMTKISDLTKDVTSASPMCGRRWMRSEGRKTKIGLMVLVTTQKG